MSTARCLEAFLHVTGLVLLHNRCHTVPVNEHLEAFRFHISSSAVELGRILRSFVLWRTFPRGFLMGTAPHSTPDVASPPWSKQPRFVSQTEAAQIVQIGKLVIFLRLERVIIMESQAGGQAVTPRVELLTAHSRPEHDVLCGGWGSYNSNYI